MNAFRLLESSPVVANVDVVDHKRWATGSYTRLIAELVDESKLFVREYVDEHERRYSYHWQSKDDALISRWDNAPHHRNLPTFPAHCHKEGNVLPSKATTLLDVLEIIKSELE